MSCTVCQHPQRQEIDQALVAGSATLAELSQQHHLSTSALHRHKAHLQANLHRAKDQVQDNLRQGCLFWLSQALELSMQTAQAAQTEGNYRIVIQAMQQGTRLVNIILKQDLPLDDTLVYAILTSPQWSAQGSLLPQDPQVLAASRQALAGVLAAPCPDPTSQPVSPRQPQPDNTPGKREKSGKMPGKTALETKNIKEFKRDMALEKVFAKNPECPGSPLLDALASGRLDIDTLHAIGAGRNLPEPLPMFEDCVAVPAS